MFTRVKGCESMGRPKGSRNVVRAKSDYETPCFLLERLSDDVLTLVSGGIDAASDYIENLNISSLF